MIENMREGVAEQLGIDHDSLARINRAIICASIGAWGTGPLRDTPGFDPLVQARSGLMAAQGGSGDPVIQAVSVHDIGSGTLLALGVVAALFARTHIGEGQSVKVSLARTSLAFQGAEFTTFSGSPTPMVGAPDFLGESAWHRLYRCSDGWIAGEFVARSDGAVGRMWPQLGRRISQLPENDYFVSCAWRRR